MTRMAKRPLPSFGPAAQQNGRTRDFNCACKPHNSTLELEYRMQRRAISADFLAFIRSPEFPCSCAKSVVALQRLDCLELGHFADRATDAVIHNGLTAFAATLTLDQPTMQSFA
jgi:hypothetical protein